MPHYRSARIDCLGIGWVVHVIRGEDSWRIWLKTERMPQRAARAQERAAAAVDAGDPQEARTSAGFQFRTRTPGKRPQPS